MPKPVAISSRWAPGHRIRIDTQAGTYEEVNPPLISAAEADVQAALLAARRKPTGYPLLWWISVCCIAFGSLTMIVRSAQVIPQ
jgi:hypothetical protein